MDKKAQAQQTLIEKVFAPVFFEKLASHGIVPQSEAEANQYLQIGHALTEKSAQVEETKKASAGANPVLTQVLQTINPEAVKADQVKQASDISIEILDANPDIAEAVLELI